MPFLNGPWQSRWVGGGHPAPRAGPLALPRAPRAPRGGLWSPATDTILPRTGACAFPCCDAGARGMAGSAFSCALARAAVFSARLPFPGPSPEVAPQVLCCLLTRESGRARVGASVSLDALAGRAQHVRWRSRDAAVGAGVAFWGRPPARVGGPPPLPVRCLGLTLGIYTHRARRAWPAPRGPCALGKARPRLAPLGRRGGGRRGLWCSLFPQGRSEPTMRSMWTAPWRRTSGKAEKARGRMMKWYRGVCPREAARTTLMPGVEVRKMFTSNRA